MPRKTTAKTARSVGRIEGDTPILPHIVADAVIGEIERCTPLELSAAEERDLADRLADRANAIYANNDRFRRKIRARGNAGRDALYAFMRHWIASELKKTRPRVFAQLPQRFMVGEELDCDALRPAHARRGRNHAARKSPAQLDREIAEFMANPKLGDKTWEREWSALLTERHSKARMPTVDELARALSYVEREYVIGDGRVDMEQWAEGLAFGRYAGDAEDKRRARELLDQVPAATWLRAAERANYLAREQGESPRYSS
ncbi:MAG TPA: hypothetical protein VLE97_11520 [Gaiellaceae bacterium]|nr:hypothetical protein [Gaiellaceae bacterium]